MPSISSKEVASQLSDAVAALGASQSVAKLTATQIYQERAGTPTSGPDATLVGGTEKVAP